ncbi:TetR family transcriptional regulator [Dactylosporangium sp. CA-233914]|uniref:TetR family transcriptional regulator n=1 Tax=Dactylosporangium sp. CA-233914 TaxID=3239934 RepID=UPI003D93AC75
MPELPSTARGAATSRRILDAAAEEFAERGIAGARIERVIHAARTNKAQLYGYFGSKDGLFDAVVADSVDRLTAAVPFDAGDLAGWAVGLYDAYLRRPDLVRLTTWIRLERRPTGTLFETADHVRKIAEIAEAQAAGRLRPGDPYDLLTMVIAMSCAWSPASSIYTATPDEPDEVHARRRAFLHDCVSRAVTAPA